MIAQFVIVFYFIVCVGIILFNCFTEIISRYRSCVLKRREQRYCEEYRQLFLDNITENKKQEKRLVNGFFIKNETWMLVLSVKVCEERNGIIFD